MSNPFTLHIFVPDGNPEGLRIFDKMNWTGKGLIFPRDKWNRVKDREEFNQIGVYILYGFGNNQSIDNDELPTVYIGQADNIKNRIDSHFKEKLFWDSCIVFVSSNDSLNRAHVTWLEYALIRKANNTNRSNLNNNQTPKEPKLREADRADTEIFLNEIYQILPLAGIHVFEALKSIRPNLDNEENKFVSHNESRNTILVAAREDNFKKSFLQGNCWFAIRIGGGMLDKIRYIAAYITHPTSAITHYASVDRIESYGDKGKYKVFFQGKPIKLKHKVPLGPNPNMAIQGPRYTSFDRLKAAKDISDLYG